MTHHVEFTLHLRRDARGRKRLSPTSPPGPPLEHRPRITRLLALAHRWNRLVGEGVVSDYAEIARLMGLSRSRVTQIVDLAYLAPDIQEDILDSRWNIPEREIRQILAAKNWAAQRTMWNRVTCGRQSSGRGQVPGSQGLSMHRDQ